MGIKIRGQISVEYLIVVGFVTFLVITVLGIGFFYSAGITDQIKFNQINSFASKVIGSAESIYYAGEPSRLTLTAYLPGGVQEIGFAPEGLLINVSSGTGTSVSLFSSNVPLHGNLTVNEGIKVIRLVATDEGVEVTDEASS